MADLAIIEEEPLEAIETADELNVETILNADSILDLLDDNEVTRIGSLCLEEFEADLQSRKEGEEGYSWEERYKRYLDLAMQVRKATTFPWHNRSEERRGGKECVSTR